MAKQKFLLSLFILATLIVAYLLYMKLTTPKVNATVKLKNPVIEVENADNKKVKVDVLEGEITLKDKSVVLKTKDGKNEYVLTYDQIESISNVKQEGAGRIDDVVDLIEFVSKLGVLAAVAIFLSRSYQYNQSQRWKKKSF